MMLLQGLAAAGLLGGALGAGPEVVVGNLHHHARALKRALADPTIALCAAPQTLPVPNIASKCDAVMQGTIEGNWSSCCSFGQVNGTLDQCRTFETTGQYCSSCDVVNGICSGIGADDSLTLSVSFTALPADKQCCKACTCYGDPECVAFNGVMDVWIPCDARTTSQCSPTQSQCGATQGPNGHTCNWVRKDRKDSSGWNFAMNGSPCVPSALESNPIMMNMHTTKGFKTDLQLGERGIISKVTFSYGSDADVSTIRADDCFSSPGRNAWKGSRGMPAGAKMQASGDGSQVSWVFFDEASKTFVHFSCVRAVQGSATGAPRINFQELTVAETTNSTGFCSSGVIADQTGPGSSTALHTQCTLSAPSALNACKSLVGESLTVANLPECAQMFCAVSPLDAANCQAILGDGTTDGAWVDVYCNSISINSGMGAAECKKQVNAQGYVWAVSSLGNGHKLESNFGRSCGTSLSEYTMDKKPVCDDGIYIEVNKGTTANPNWVPVFFIPVSNPPCNGNLTVTGEDNLANPLFAYPIRIRQCDVKSNPVCNAVSTCSETYAVAFKLDYNNDIRTVIDAWKNNYLQCIPDQNGSTTWCLPNSPDFPPPTKMCPCPDTGRRLLGLA